MKIIVDELPSAEQDCLFSYWDNRNGWLCSLYKNKAYGIHTLTLKTPICQCGENCPYLREESWFGIKDE